MQEAVELYPNVREADNITDSIDELNNDTGKEHIQNEEVMDSARNQYSSRPLFTG